MYTFNITHCIAPDVISIATHQSRLIVSLYINSLPFYLIVPYVIVTVGGIVVGAVVDTGS